MRRTEPQRPPRRRGGGCVAALLLLFGLGACSSPERVAPDLSAPREADMPVPAVGNEAYGAAVRALASADFERRTRAARELVAAKDAAVPALGRAGDLPVPVAGGLQVSATRSVLQSILSTADDDALERHLGSPWPNVRRAAAEEIGQRDRWPAIPRLIERLEDPDDEVRAAAAASLRRLTNNFLGYRAQASLTRRRAGADRWRTWWSQEGRARLGERGPRAENP